MLKEAPYWWETAAPLPKLITRPLPDHADVVIIGSGYTGLSAARILAMRGVDVVVLEKETFGWGASSRNGGQVLTGLKWGPAALVEKVGLASAKEMYAASLAAIDYLAELIEEENIDCEYVRCGHIEAAWKAKHFDAYRSEQELLEREFNHRVQLLDRAEQQRELGTTRYHGLLIDEASAAVHPTKYVRGLAISASALGALLLENTPAVALKRQGTKYSVKTPQGTIETEQVLIATNGYTDAALANFQRRLMPIGSFIIATEPLSPEIAQRLLPQRRVVFDSKHYLYYFRLSADNRLLFGGRAEYKPPTPENTRRSAQVLQRGMVKIFPELQDVQVDYVWSGQLAATLDFFPRVGQLDGIYYALAYAGHGVAMATYLGSQLANIMCGAPGKNPFRDLPFKPIPLYNGRPWFMPLGALWYQVLDLLK